MEAATWKESVLQCSNKDTGWLLAPCCSGLIPKRKVRKLKPRLDQVSSLKDGASSVVADKAWDFETRIQVGRRGKCLGFLGGQFVVKGLIAELRTR